MRHLLCMLALSLIGRAVAQQPGTLDLTYDDDGIVVLEDFGFSAAPRLVALPDLTAIVAFQHNVGGSVFVRVVRVLVDGSIDPDFGSNGSLLLSSFSALTEIVVQSDGNFIVVGPATGGSQPDGMDILLERYHPDGTLDGTYGIGESCRIELPEAVVTVNDAIIGPDNSVYLCGRRGTQHYLARADAQGQLDPSFGVAGFRIGDLPTIEKIVLSSIGDLQFINDLGGQGPGRIAMNGQGPFWQWTTLQYDKMHYPPMVMNIYDRSLARFRDLIEGPMPGAPTMHGVSIFQYSPILFSGSPTIGWNYVHITGSLFGEGLSGDVRAVGTDQVGNFFVGSRLFVADGWRINCKGATNFSSEFDTDYGIDGNSITIFDADTEAFISRIVPQPDGKLLAAGTATVNGTDKVVLARYHNIPDPRSRLSLRMFLGGCYDAGSGLMRDDLRVQGMLPTLQPYQAPVFAPGNGLGQWATAQHILAVDGEEAIVDWVWLELINATDSSNVMATRVGLLHRNGWVTSSDGVSPIDFGTVTGDYFLHVRHRNHLGATLAQPLSLSPTLTTVDMTLASTPTFGTDAQMEVTGVRMLWPGDANADSRVKYVGQYNDRDAILVAIGGAPATATVSGYLPEDVNMDGIVKYVGVVNDRDIVLQTIGGVEVTVVRFEQRP